MHGTQHLLRVAATAAVALTLVGVASVAYAQDEPPDVRGEQVTVASDRLAAWNKSVFFIYEPPPDSGLDIDISDVVVSRMQWRGSQGTAAPRPVVTLVLGRVIPDLAGMTRTEALAAIDHRELELTTNAAPAHWVVGRQDPDAGTILEFTRPNTVAVTLVDPSPPPGNESWWGLSRPAVIAIGGSSAAALLVLAVLASFAVRRAGRRRAGRQTPPVEQIEVRTVAGQIIGPDLIERVPR